MTPKERAEKLIFRFNAETTMQQPYNHAVHMEKALQSALICANEIYLALLSMDEEKERYWLEVIDILQESNNK